MNKYNYVITVKINNKYASVAISVDESDNLLKVFNQYTHAIAINAKPTYKAALELARVNNEGFIKNNEYLISGGAELC